MRAHLGGAPNMDSEEEETNGQSGKYMGLSYAFQIKAAFPIMYDTCHVH